MTLTDRLNRARREDPRAGKVRDWRNNDRPYRAWSAAPPDTAHELGRKPTRTMAGAPAWVQRAQASTLPVKVYA